MAACKGDRTDCVRRKAAEGKDGGRGEGRTRKAEDRFEGRRKGGKQGGKGREENFANGIGVCESFSNHARLRLIFVGREDSEARREGAFRVTCESALGRLEAGVEGPEAL